MQYNYNDNVFTLFTCTIVLATDVCNFIKIPDEIAALNSPPLCCSFSAVLLNIDEEAINNRIKNFS